MTTKRPKERGQMSFDLAFAIILVLIICGMLGGYWSASRQSVEDGRRLMALNVLADYVQGNLNSFYNSVSMAGEATYRLPLPSTGLFDAAALGEYNLGIKYSITLNGQTMAVTDALDTSSTPASVQRNMGFSITCSTGSSSPTMAMGSTLTLKDCILMGDDLNCACA